MSIAPDNLSHQVVTGFTGTSRSANDSKEGKSFHRIQAVRQQQGVSLRSVARQMNSTTATVREQEKADADLNLSELLEWQRVLDVPLADLLEDSETSLSRPVMERAQMVRVMKTAASIAEQAESDGVKRLSDMLKDQLISMMPELAEVSAWHSVGQRRSLNEYGKVVDRRLRDDFFTAHREE